MYEDLCLYIDGQFLKGEGCQQCYDTGFKGRIGIYEILEATRELRQTIGEGATLEALKSKIRESGGQLLLDEGIRFAEEGKTSLDEVMRVAYFE